MPRSPQVRTACLSPGSLGSAQPSSSTAVARGNLGSSTEIWNLAKASLFGEHKARTSGSASGNAGGLPDLHSRFQALFLERFDGELQSRIDSLLGPLTEDALTEFLMFAGYLASNNKLSERQSNDLLEWIVSTQNLSRLRSFCSLKIPTVTAFARCMFESAVRARLPNLDAARVLLETGADPNLPIRDGDSAQTPLMIAASRYSPHGEFFHMLIAKGADVNYVLADSYGTARTALHAAVENANRPFIRLLIDAGADINPHRRNERCYSLLEDSLGVAHDGCTDIDLPVLRILLEEGVDVKAPTRISPHRTALQSAAASGNLPLVRFLLGCGANVNAPAATESHSRDRPPGGTLLQSFLIAGAASFDYDSDDDEPELLRDDSVEFARILLGCGLEINAPAIWDNALFKREREIREKQRREYEQCVGEVNYEDTFAGVTALQGAVMSNKIEMVELILKAGADINAPACGCGNGGRTALQMAVGLTEPFIGLLQLLLDGGADVNAPAAPGFTGRTALEVAIESGDIGRVRTLLEYNADCNAPGRSTPALTLAAGSDIWGTDEKLEVVNMLLDAGADVNYGFDTELGRAPLVAAVQEGGIEVVLLLLENGAHVNPAIGKTPLEAAMELEVERDREEIIQLLLDAGALGSPPPRHIPASRELRNALSESCPRPDHIKKLLDEGAVINEHYPGDGGAESGWASNALPLAVGKPTILKLLLGAGADVNATIMENDDDLGTTALLKAARCGDIRTTLLLLRYGANVNARPCPFGGWTALQAAAEGGYIELVDILLNAGADINAEAHPDGGRTALQAAAIGGDTHLVEMFLRKGAYVNAAAAESSGVTALQGAAIQGHLQIALSLLKAGANPNTPAAKFHGRTALEGAAEHGRLDVFQLLLNSGADIGGAYLERARELAFLNGQGAMVAFLDERPSIQI